MLTHIPAHQRQWVVLADEPDGLDVLPRLDEGDVARDVHPRRTTRYAGHRHALLEAAGVVPEMELEVIAEAPHRLEGHLARLVAYRAVARQIDGLCGPLDEVDGVLLGRAVEDPLHELAESWQADATGRALPAALRHAHAHEGGRELDRTRFQGTHGKALLDGLVEVVHDLLRLAPLHDVQSCHRSPNPGSTWSTK